MIFPKKRMTTRELIEIGFKADELRALAKRKGQNYASQLVPNGTIRWDTDRLQKALDKMLVRQ